MSKEVRVPNLGDFSDVEVIEVMISPGQDINTEDPVASLESDKATMDIPAPGAGTIEEVYVRVGDRVSAGDLLYSIKETGAKPTEREKQGARVEQRDSDAEANATGDYHADVLVLGSGPGGYTAAFRAADLNLNTVLVERYPSLGGVCLNVGCIPSKALLHGAKVISEAREMKEFGIEFGKPKINLDKLRTWKGSLLGQLTNGLNSLAKQRRVEVIQGNGRFESAHRMTIETSAGEKVISFKHAIIAAGSQPAKVPFIPEDPRIIDSTGALELKNIPQRLLVIGGGIIGLEMATVYHELGSRITIVEMLDRLMIGADPDIVKPFQKHIQKQYENIYTGTRVTGVSVENNGVRVKFDGKNAPAEDIFDNILVAVGRTPNGNEIGADRAGVNVDHAGFIAVDNQQRTNIPHIFAIGDIVGQPMLAHKAAHEGKVAAEVIAGHKSSFDARVIPSVAYTDPEVAWAGITEEEAKANNIAYEKAVFPWAASGRSLSLGRNEGMTKLIFDKSSTQVIGAGIVGPHAGDLIAEVALAIEMGCDAADISMTIHPHPTLSETIALAAEMFEGTITDLYVPRKK